MRSRTDGLLIIHTQFTNFTLYNYKTALDFSQGRTPDLYIY